MNQNNRFRDQLLYLIKCDRTYRECRAELCFMHSVEAVALADLYASGRIDESRFAEMSVDLARDLREAQSFLRCKFANLRIQ